MQFIKIFIHTILSLCMCSAYIAYKYLSYSDLKELVEIWREYRNLQKVDKNESADLFSSVYCRGNNHTNRFCRFQNLCYDSNSELFLFLFHNTKSILSGLPPDRFSPTLVDFSSVLDHNTLYFNYVEVPSSSTSRFNVSHIYGHALMFKRFNPDNLMHVFHDDLLPAFATINEISYANIFLVFADNRPPGPYSILYENFLSRKPLYITSLPSDSIHCFQNVYIGLNKQSTWYQYGFKEPQGPLQTHHDASPLILKFQNYFIKQFALDPPMEKKNALLLVRKHNRKILNEIEISNSLSRVSGFVTRVMGLEDRSVLEVIQEIVHSRLLVGMHGSSLILSLFLSPHSIILELFPYGVDPSISTPYRTLAKMPGLRHSYQSWENLNVTNSVPHPEYPKELGGVRHLSFEEQEKIQSSVVEPFLCCDNPVWLYRIYQDTVVEASSFEAALEEVIEVHNDMQAFSEGSEGHMLYPSEVRNIACTAGPNNQTLTFSWDEPWNLIFMNATVIEYEVWIQDVATNDVEAFLMKRNVFKFVVKSETNVCYTWVRCYVDGRIGPFNSSPFVCAW